MNSIKNIIIFATGAAIGSLVTWKLLKTKYEQIAQEEIDSVKEVFNKRLEEAEESANDSTDFRNKPDLMEYASKVKDLGYSNKDVKEDEDEMEGPQVITPDEFGENDEYDTDTLYYYNNGVLTDEFDEVVNPDYIDDLLGPDTLNLFEETGEDSIYVRNDAECGYYEILRCDKDFEIESEE